MEDDYSVEIEECYYSEDYDDVQDIQESQEEETNIKFE